ncbi:hypothetical protein [Pseudomonas aeruginosa]|uniref:hypothetical protein n=1 Tax=Pseudomonas aeruginosa TaxID=287 RepID=UPI001F095AE3|nr:hypothetical protein [Pseudomonas aeruginosa]
MARQNSAAKTTAKSKTDPATEKPKDEALPGSTEPLRPPHPEAHRQTSQHLGRIEGVFIRPPLSAAVERASASTRKAKASLKAC